MKLADMANKLRELADDLNGTSVKIELDRDDLTIAEAIKGLRAILGKNYVSIKFDLTVPSSGPQQIEWQVYDGDRFHKGRTLRSAVKAATEYHCPDESENPTEDASKALNAITAPDEADLSPV